MTEEAGLLQKREELKRQVSDGEYDTLVGKMFDKTGYLIQKLTRNPEPPPFWYSAVVIGLIVILIPFLTMLVSGENPENTPHILNLRFFVFLRFSAVGMVIAALIAVRITAGMVRTTISDNLLESIESAADLTDLQGWLVNFSDAKKPLFFSLGFVVLVSPYFIFVVLRGGFFYGIASVIFALIVIFLLGLFLYYCFRMGVLPVRLSRYQFKLYTVDPSSSEVVDRLSDMGNTILYTMGGLAAISSLILALLGLLTLDMIIFLVIVAWIPLISFFAIMQYTLAKIITRGKRKTLNEIQAQVETLQTPENLVDEETMEAIKRLIDYHNLIKGTPNSAFNLRAGLNFLNSLLLPVLAFLLANLDTVLGLF